MRIALVALCLLVGCATQEPMKWSHVGSGIMFDEFGYLSERDLRECSGTNPAYFDDCYAISAYGRRGELLMTVHGKYIGGKRSGRTVVMHHDHARYENPCENRQYFLENGVKEGW